MPFNLKATNITLENGIREYLDKRLFGLEKLIDIRDPSVMTAVELGRSTKHHQNGEVFYAEITLYRGKESWRASANAVSLQAAIDAMRDAIARELSANKSKRSSFLRRSGLAAKELLRGGVGRLRYLGRPARAGLRYLKNLRWKRKNE